MARSNEPLWWAPFMAGAGMSAFFMPILIVITSIALARGWVDEPQLYKLMQSYMVRIPLALLVSLSLIHAAHRLRFLLVDLGLKHIRGLISVVCYGAALVGTVLAILAIRISS